MNRRSFFRDMLLSFAATTALARSSVALVDDPWFATDGEVDFGDTVWVSHRGGDVFVKEGAWHPWRHDGHSFTTLAAAPTTPQPSS